MTVVSSQRTAISGQWSAKERGLEEKDEQSVVSGQQKKKRLKIKE